MTATNPVPELPPLGPDDFDAQDAVLDVLRESNEFTPDWEFCEGFLAALVVGRRTVPPEEYWPVLLGEGFRPMSQMEFVWRFQRRMQEVQAALDAPVDTLEDERAYQPEILDVRGAVLALPEGERGDGRIEDLPSFGEAWAHGFLHTVQNFPDDWAAPRDREQADLLADTLDCIEALAAPDTGVPALSMHAEDGPPSVSEDRLDAYGEALWAVYDLRQFWKSLGPRTGTLRKPPEPGRNDPCPCGSGKKFKKCHGA
jgi:uncharacterized protein